MNGITLFQITSTEYCVQINNMMLHVCIISNLITFLSASMLRCYALEAGYWDYTNIDAATTEYYGKYFDFPSYL